MGFELMKGSVTVRSNRILWDIVGFDTCWWDLCAVCVWYG